MKNNLLKSIKILGLCLVFSLFVGVAIASAQNAPANNVAGPLNVGPSYQAKEGSLRLTNGGFRSAGPGLFDDIVVVGYSDGSAPSGGGGAVSFQNNSEKKSGFFTKIAKFFGLSTERALAATPTCGNANGGTFSNLANPSFVSGGTTYNLCSSLYQTSVIGLVGSGPDANYWRWTCRHTDYSNNTIGNISCSANKTSPIGGGTIPVGGGTVGEAVGLSVGELAATTYRFTVNGNSDLRGYTRVTGAMDVGGNITSGGKNVCLQDGTNCTSVASSPTVSQFGGTYMLAYNGTSFVCGALALKNPLAGNTCACPAGFTSYIMMEAQKQGVSSYPVQLHGCYKSN